MEFFSVRFTQLVGEEGGYEIVPPDTRKCSRQHLAISTLFSLLFGVALLLSLYLLKERAKKPTNKKRDHHSQIRTPAPHPQKFTKACLFPYILLRNKGEEPLKHKFSKSALPEAHAQKIDFVNQARKRHININFFVRLVLGQTRVFSLFYAVEARQTRVCPWDKPGEIPGAISGTKGGTESLCEKSLCAFFARFF